MRGGGGFAKTCKTRRHVWNVSASRRITSLPLNVARELERSTSISKSKSKAERGNTYARVYVYQRPARAREILADACIKAGVTAASAWTNRDSAWSTAFFFLLYFIHSFSPLLRPPGHTDSPPSVEYCMLTGLRPVGSRSRALQLRRGMHARSANPVLGWRRARPEPLLPCRWRLNRNRQRA